MFLSKSFVATLFVLGAIVATTAPAVRALEGEEEACPSFANSTTGNPSCEDCISSSCGYAIDHGDCVKDCSTVTDTMCFSLSTSNTTVVADICTMAMSAGGGSGGGTEEAMCAAFTTSRAAPTCETCVSAGCGWTADDGDCLANCAEVNDGATCLELTGEASQTADAVCASITSGTGSGTGTGSTGKTSAGAYMSEGAAAAVTISAAVASLLL